MNILATTKLRFVWIGLALLGAALVAGCDHIHDPWVEPGSMPAERSVGLAHDTDLTIRLLRGQTAR